MTCRPITLASRYADGIVQRGDTPNFDIFAAVNRENNPTDAYDKQSLLNVTNALNNVLARSDTTATPLVNDRKFQGPILFAEIASFLTESGLNIDNVEEALTNFNDYVKANPKTDDNKNLNVPSDVDAIYKQSWHAAKHAASPPH